MTVRLVDSAAPKDSSATALKAARVEAVIFAVGCKKRSTEPIRRATACRYLATGTVFAATGRIWGAAGPDYLAIGCNSQSTEPDFLSTAERKENGVQKRERGECGVLWLHRSYANVPAFVIKLGTHESLDHFVIGSDGFLVVEKWLGIVICRTVRVVILLKNEGAIALDTQYQQSIGKEV